jgi:prepilin-type N-terminal cleavage/methylation domain-containing protein
MQFHLKDSAGRTGRPYLAAAEPARRQKLTGTGRKKGAFTLVEVVISMAIVALVFAGIINAYIQTGLRLEWTGYSLAAQSLALETIEQARSTLWDPTQYPPVNEITNLNLMGTAGSINTAGATWTGYSTNTLDIPVPNGGTNVLATNYVSVQMSYVSTYANVQMEIVTVQTVWPFIRYGNNVYFTNTIATIITPDNRNASDF